MAVYFKDLMAQLAREMGDVDSTDIIYTANQLFSALNDAVLEFNEDAVNQQYVGKGGTTGDTEYISPEPGNEDQRLIVLYAALILTRGEKKKASRRALSHSNVSGRTDTTGIAASLDKDIEYMEKKIKHILRERTRRLVDKDICGTELKSKETEQVEGIGIVTITEEP